LLASLNDVMFQMRYTALHGGSTFEQSEASYTSTLPALLPH
jgi:hypothetical protein